MAAAAVLPDDVITEILIRLPPNDPSCLLRASLVCKPWLNIVSGSGFRRRLGAFHRTPPMLGFLRDTCRRAHAPRFTATTASAFSLPAAAAAADGTPDDDSLGTALDCRHGRVLFLATSDLLIVWEPITGALRRVPNGALVCDASGACDHSACSAGGPFLIVFVFSKSSGGPMIIESETVAEVCVYSSETETWDDELTTTYYIDSIVTTKRSVLVGRTLYIPFHFGYIIEYDLCGRELVLIQIPDVLLTDNKGKLMLVSSPGEGSGMGVASVDEDSTLSVWLREASGHGDLVWEQHKVIDLVPLLPIDDDIELLGFGEGVNVIFLRTYGGIFMIKLDSELVSKVCDPCDDSEVLLPFISFYTPGTASFVADYRPA